MSADVGFTWSRYYEDNRDLIAAVSNSFNNTVISSSDYVNDELGRRIARNDYYINRGSTKFNSFGYNTFSEVTNVIMGAGTYSYEYDPIGNRIQEITNSVATAYESNGLNQYTNITGGFVASPVYDLDGNLLHDNRFAYTWDAENRLVALSNLVSGEVSSYHYDHQSRRIAKLVTDNSSLITQNSSFTYDGWNMVYEMTSNSAASTVVTNLHVWGLDVSGSLRGAGGVGGLLASVISNASHVAAYVNNFNVSEMIATDGSISAHYEYDPFGVTTVVDGPLDAAFSFRYSTKYTDLENEFNYYGYRSVDVSVGRWLSRDILDETGGLNLYVFCQNAAIGEFDYLGMLATPPSQYTPPLSLDKSCSDIENDWSLYVDGPMRSKVMDAKENCGLKLPLSVQCGCCDNKDAGGYYSSKGITLCNNKDQSEYDWWMIINHELQHQVDGACDGAGGCGGQEQVNQNKPSEDLKKLMCTELKAYSNYSMSANNKKTLVESAAKSIVAACKKGSDNWNLVKSNNPEYANNNLSETMEEKVKGWLNDMVKQGNCL